MFWRVFFNICLLLQELEQKYTTCLSNNLIFFIISRSSSYIRQPLQSQIKRKHNLGNSTCCFSQHVIEMCISSFPKFNLTWHNWGNCPPSLLDKKWLKEGGKRRSFVPMGLHMSLKILLGTWCDFGPLALQINVQMHTFPRGFVELTKGLGWRVGKYYICIYESLVFNWVPFLSLTCRN